MNITSNYCKTVVKQKNERCALYTQSTDSAKCRVMNFKD